MIFLTNWPALLPPVQHGCVFHVASEGERLLLHDVHLQDAETGQFSRPATSGELPQLAALYQQVLLP